tara:strand:- start:1227 stop:1529 length:303 start_codon:yes stop_codon:yes gene_type:complete
MDISKLTEEDFDGEELIVYFDKPNHPDGHDELIHTDAALLKVVRAVLYRGKDAYESALKWTRENNGSISGWVTEENDLIEAEVWILTHQMLEEAYELSCM